MTILRGRPILLLAALLATAPVLAPALPVAPAAAAPVVDACSSEVVLDGAGVLAARRVRRAAAALPDDVTVKVVTYRTIPAGADTLFDALQALSDQCGSWCFRPG